MKRIMLIVFFMSFILMSSMAQDNNELVQKITVSQRIAEDIEKAGGRIKVHIIDKGETFEDIALKYDCESSLILLLNPTVDFPCVGMEVKVPVMVSDSKIKDNFLTSSNSYYKAAQNYFDSGQYDKAIKSYNNIIEDGSASLLAFYNRGISFYKKGKYGQALKDLRHVAACDKHGDYEDLDDLIDQIEDLDQERKAHRTELWGSIISATLGAAAMTYAAIEVSKSDSRINNQNNYSYSGYSGSNSPDASITALMPNSMYGSSACQSLTSSTYPIPQYQNYGFSDMQLNNPTMDDLINPQYALAQTNRDHWNEYMTFTNGGETMSIQQFDALQGQAIMEMKGNYNTNTNSNTTTEPTGKKTNIKDSDTCPSLYVQSGKWYCAGTGKCGMCGGDGRMSGHLGQGANSLDCTLCKGSGRCQYCNK